MITQFARSARLGLVLAAFSAGAAFAAESAIDNSSIGKPDFREHKATYGLVYTLPAETNEALAGIKAQLKSKLVAFGLTKEAELPNIPHITVVHIHNADAGTPARMLKVLPKVPGPLSVKLKKFYTTEAAKGAGHPWWLDLGVVKEGASFEAMMAYNTVATAALAPLRDGPLPRVTGPVYAKMGEAGRELVANVGVSGVNVVKDGKELRSHNPHNTLVYSMVPFDAEIQAKMNALADDFNKELPEGLDTTLKTVSIVELQFAGNVVREIYRISLEDGSVTEVATGKKIAMD